MADLVSEHPPAVNILTVPKERKSLKQSTFIIFLNHSDIDRAGKRPSWSDLKF